MPIYEFNCQACGNPFESLVFGFSTDNVECPECKSKNVKKQISSFAVNSSGSEASSFSTNSVACSTGST